MQWQYTGAVTWASYKQNSVPRIFTVTWDGQSSDNLDINQKVLLCIKCFMLYVEHFVELHWLYDIFLVVGAKYEL